jgi:hypothetical protein
MNTAEESRLTSFFFEVAACVDARAFPMIDRLAQSRTVSHRLGRDRQRNLFACQAKKSVCVPGKEICLRAKNRKRQSLIHPPIYADGGSFRPPGSRAEPK